MKIMKVSNYKKHALRSYMEGVDRGDRANTTAESFTPDDLVNEMLDKVEDIDCPLFDNKTFLDPSCGDGQFLVWIVIRKMEAGATLEQALSTTYGIEMMPDNVELAKSRLRGPLLPGERKNSVRLNIINRILARNIVCASVVMPSDSRYLGEPTVAVGAPGSSQEVMRLEDLW